MNLVFLGPPGAGKGTIASQAKIQYDIPHISTGDLFRNHIKHETELGKQVKAILAGGDLVPDSITIAMVKERLLESDAKKGFILDGFPRTIVQAEALKELTTLDAVVNFELGREQVIKRLSGRRMCKSTGRIYHLIYDPPKKEGIDDETGEPLIQREDDKAEAIAHRLDVYLEQTEPLIAFYKKEGLLVDIDASPSPDSVMKQLASVLKK
ncbi:MAG TPA: adenylate kinase [Sphaerochaeta sp.]|nr:adenylate kinase [Sphaerochaeta sp.]